MSLNNSFYRLDLSLQSVLFPNKKEKVPLKISALLRGLFCFDSVIFVLQMTSTFNIAKFFLTVS